MEQAHAHAVVDAAAKFLSMHCDSELARVLRAELPPRPPRPDARGFAAASRDALALDPSSALLLAEAWMRARLREHLARYHAARARRPVVLKEEREPIALQSIRSIVQTEDHAPRREALLAAYADGLHSLQRDARAVVDEMRDAFGALEGSVQNALCPPSRDARAVLAATNDLWRELDERVLRSQGIDRATLRWGERVRSLVGPSVVREIPPATWADLGTRWWERVGLGDALRRVHGALGASSRQAEGVFTFVDPERGVATLAGRPAPSAWDAAEVMGAASRCASTGNARGLWSSHRRGVDRGTDFALHALGRHLLHDRGFLQKVVRLDGATRERVQVEALHGALARIRWDAVMGGFVRDALARTPGLSAGFVESVTAALGAAPPTLWAAHLTAESLEHGGPWGSRWGQRAVGARAEVGLREALRVQFDEDWHRNPRAGEWLVVTMSAMRSRGATAWTERGELLEPAALGARLAEDYIAARR